MGGDATGRPRAPSTTPAGLTSPAGVGRGPPSEVHDVGRRRLHAVVDAYDVVGEVTDVAGIPLGPVDRPERIVERLPAVLAAVDDVVLGVGDGVPAQMNFRVAAGAGERAGVGGHRNFIGTDRLAVAVGCAHAEVISSCGVKVMDDASFGGGRRMVGGESCRNGAAEI